MILYCLTTLVATTCRFKITEYLIDVATAMASSNGPAHPWQLQEYLVLAYSRI